MTPERSLLLRHCNNYGAGFFTDSHFVFPQPIQSPLIPLLMAEEGPSNSSSKKPVEKEQEQEQEQGRQGESTERAETYEAGWLQLGLTASAPTPSSAATGGSMELRLFPERPPPELKAPVAAASAVASTSYGVGRFGWRPESSGSAEGAAPAAAYADELRVISPPQRAPAGIWISLRPAENQVKEPFLPQLPKSYLRIKDVRMTIRLLMRYLANKLGLHDESEVEITCRNQQLMPFATLEDVRDHIWFVRDAEAPGPSSPPTDHVMKLYYSRRA